MTSQLKDSAQQVQNKLMEFGYANKVIELPDSTRTAQEAADTIGCEVAHIAKSIIFRLKNNDKPLLVIASGVNRINEKQINTYLNDSIGKADADFVRTHTGFVIGGVPPLGHIESIITLIDEDLLQFKEIWAAAGHPRAVFQLTPEELVQMTKGQVISVK
ncbi:prolyl-tRNA editing enzyme YbaK/EbsC (Cys-tRNA(Pro) deacylase) [Paenibacillus sp. 4624]|uniref:YbaK/EbsC family protein n=1 Tax=Paenibacillus amylolyticus TaxID=1451 RepID=A0A5M9WP40_PAEAM|nr:YbaK/EbsC family protein [Paenibacillus amylolyticus]KAA8783335.1 YbaK/EbsC family protein [Paenibacillus amylolyticus]